MSGSRIESAVRSNWYLFVLLGVVVVATLATFLFSGKAEAPEADPNAVTPAPAASAEEAVKRVEAASLYKPITMEDKTRKNINDYQKAIEADPDGEDTPLNMRRIGNLYVSRLGELEKAVEQYETLIYRFPEWEGLDKVYPNLATCYHRLGDVDKEMWTYERMLEKFPEDSQQHLLAKQKLGR